MRGSLLSLTRALWRIVGARQGSSQHGRPPAVTAGGLVPSQTYKDLAARADNTAVLEPGLSDPNQLIAERFHINSLEAP